MSNQTAITEEQATIVTETDPVMEAIEQITALVNFKVMIIEDDRLRKEYFKDCNYKLQYDWETSVYTLISPKATIKENIINVVEEIKKIEQIQEIEEAII